MKEPDRKSVEENTTRDLKFYSQKAIGIATFLGGPLAAGYLIRQNYLSLGDLENGRKAFVIGVFSTIVVCVLAFLIPEADLGRFLTKILPAVYTGVTYLIVESIHGEMLDKHEEYENEFQSGWKVAGVGFTSMVVILVGLFGWAYLSTDNELYEEYNKEMLVFDKNVDDALRVYNSIDSKSNTSLVMELEFKVIPKWEENIEIVKRTSAYENLPEELVHQNKFLLEYCELYLKAAKLMRKAFIEDTFSYNREMDELHRQIKRVVEELESSRLF